MKEKKARKKTEKVRKEKNKSLLVVLSGPSGTGKDTMRMAFVEKTHFNRSISVTTRKQGNSEKEGVDYYFVSKEDFEKKIENNEILEYDTYNGNYYGTLWKTVRDYVKNGIDVIFALTIPGALAIKKAFPDDAVSVFVLPPDMAELENRIRTRARGENEECIKERLRIAAEREIPRAVEFDYSIINDDFDRALSELCDIVEKEKEKRRSEK